MEFRTLKANEIDCRIQSLNEKNGAVGAVVLLYKDARVDMRMLDEVVGALNWKREHAIIGDRLYCTVSIFNEHTGEWVGKSDVGTESNTEKEKGQASDSFKRACFNWGIGRELYSAPFTYINLQKGEWNTDKNGKPKSYAKFTVKEIDYDENRNISKLIIVDSKGSVRFTMGGNTAPAQAAKPKVKHVAGYDEFVALQAAHNVPPAEITKYIAGTFKKPRLALLDEFEMVAALDWLKKRTTESKGFGLYDNKDAALEHEDAGDRI
nr:MAG TPA: DNA repair protein-like protein [Caudoviricetes sp.]